MRRQQEAGFSGRQKEGQRTHSGPYNAASSQLPNYQYLNYGAGASFTTGIHASYYTGQGYSSWRPANNLPHFNPVPIIGSPGYGFPATNSEAGITGAQTGEEGIRRQFQEEDNEQEEGEIKFRETNNDTTNNSISEKVKMFNRDDVVRNFAGSPSTIPKMSPSNLRQLAQNAAKTAHERLLNEKKGVTSWKVAQSVLVALKAESLESVGIRLYDIPYLRKLLNLEGKVNTYIHCHVAVRRIVTLHDLIEEICQNEGIKDFDELKLGPVVHHPLVVRYFAPPGGSDVFKITTEDLLNHLSNYMNKHQGKIEIEDFLSFVAKSESLPSPQHLCVRIQNFGMYVSFIRREKIAEKTMASQRAALSTQKESAAKTPKKDINITKRIDAFLAAANAEAGIISDEDDDKTTVSKRSALSTGEAQVNRCPYPSAAEERVRVLTKLPADLIDELARSTYEISKQELEEFICDWKTTCQKESIPEVFTKMLCSQEHSKKKKKKLARLFRIYPAIGILNVAILSMKSGHWNTLCDVVDGEVNKEIDEKKCLKSTRVEFMESEVQVSTSMKADETFVIPSEVCIPLEKLFKDILEILDEMLNDFSTMSVDEKIITLTHRIIEREKALLEQFTTSDSLKGIFEVFSKFIEKYMGKISSLFSAIERHNVNKGNMMLPSTRLQTFVTQATSAVGDVGSYEDFENYLLQLFGRQFPAHSVSKTDLSLAAKCGEPEQVTNFTSVYSCALIASRTLRLPLLTFKSTQEKESKYSNSVGLLGTVSSANARNCLLSAPMYVNLVEWSQWDHVFAPVLGPLLDWLENESAIPGLLCLVTCEGCIIRIDGSATVETFLATAVKGAGKQAALQLVSVLALYGGVDRTPQSLLKSYFSQAIEILIERFYTADKKRKAIVDFESVRLRKSVKQSILDDAGICARSATEESNTGSGKRSETFLDAIRFVLDLLSSLPSEFVIFTASIFIPVLLDIIPGAAALMLDFCDTSEVRILLHKIGLAMGIVEWVKDLKSLFVEVHTPVRGITQPSEMAADNAGHKFPLENNQGNDKNDEALAERTVSAQTSLSIEAGSCVESLDLHNNDGMQIGIISEAAIIKYKIEEELAASNVIAMIRKEEFGMDLDLQGDEMKLLAKQHARIGRALNCLSRELYSGDSHFVLELVQNADDNHYAANVNPMLVFVLRHDKVVVVNNEIGFTAANMKALCDVGNSTKSGSASGYIGHKGIGFKSVFRVTDCPEIHSRGFHVKFDITEGNIGFILPKMIPPVNDWDKIQEELTVVENMTKSGKQSWNTCLVLPLKSAFVDGPDVETLSSKLSDIQPSLLLFLHQLCSITIKDELSGSTRVMQRYNLEDGFIQVIDNGKHAYWLVVKEQLNAAVERSGVRMTEIALAFPLLEVSPGVFEACLDHQQVFSFLPLRSYGLRFIVQADFVLPSSREELDSDNVWNQWLLSEIPNVFLKSVEAIKEVSCFKTNPGKAASILMSFVPLEGEVQGFFYSLPRMILSNLRTTQCLPIEGKQGEWALPCVLLGGWNESSRNLLPDQLLEDLLGLHYLDRDVILSPAIASELGIHMHGFKILIDFMGCLCERKELLEKMGPRWVSSWLVALHRCLVGEFQQFSQTRVELEKLKKLQGLRFIPLSNGKYTSVEDGPVWLPCGGSANSTEVAILLEHFSLLYSELRTVHALLLDSSYKGHENADVTVETYDNWKVETENITFVSIMLERIGVGQIQGHDIITTHIIPNMISENIWSKPKEVLMQYLAFVMIHLNSSCKQCKTERLNIMEELKKYAVLVTNKGFKRLSEEPVHFGKEFGCSLDIKNIMNALHLEWTEIDPMYLSVTDFGGCKDDVACSKWRSFLKELGVTDFVKLNCVEKQTSVSIDEETFVKYQDCESPELIPILERISASELNLPDRTKQSSNLLSAFDLLWDDYNSILNSFTNDKVMPSFIRSLRSFDWVKSSFDENLYNPTKLFYRCPSVESILGDNAPYAFPQLRSITFASALGLQTTLSAPVILNLLSIWNQQRIQLSLAQMTRLYNFLWNEMEDHNECLVDFFKSQAWIFVPDDPSKQGNISIWGKFHFQRNVFWSDRTGCYSLIFQRKSPTQNLVELSNIYPTLRSFFVDVCHVQQELSLKNYSAILKEIADTHTPLNALNQVLAVLSMWSESIKVSRMSPDDVQELKDLLSKKNYRLLPTVQDKWVSLHSSEGVVCWCDDDVLGKQFVKSSGVFYVCVDSTDGINVDNLIHFLNAMGVSPLSKVVERDPITYGAQSSKQLEDILTWALPYVQRYLRKWHVNVYKEHQLPDFQSKLHNFRAIACEELYYRHKLPGGISTSSERYASSYLLEGNVLYATHTDNLTALFLEFSKLFFNGKSDIQLANFLHLILLSIQSGSQDDELEGVLKSQGIESFPENETTWSFQFKDETVSMDNSENNVSQHFHFGLSKPRKVQGKLSIWPQRSLVQSLSGVSHLPRNADRFEECQKSLDLIMKEITIERKAKAGSDASQNDNEPQFAYAESKMSSSEEVPFPIASLNGIQRISDISLSSNTSQFVFSDRDQLSFGRPNEQQQMLTGRLGEAVVFKHLLEKYGREHVKWINEEAESGFPYDIVVDASGGQKQLVEVKTTWSEDKDWFEISSHEWDLACKLGDRYIIIRVFLVGQSGAARFLWLPNVVKLCQERVIKLALVLPRNQ